MSERTRTETPLLTVNIARETDLLLARRRATEIAGLLGMEKQDQTRIATALSEIVRNAYTYAKGGTVEYFVDRVPRPALRIVVEDHGPGIPHLASIWSGEYQSSSGMGLGIIGARRLTEGFDLEESPRGTRVTLVKHVGGLRPPQPPPDKDIIAVLTASRSTDAVSILLDQNHELMQLLEQLRLREMELQRLNQELEETNRGVMVLYADLEDKAQVVQQANDMKSRFLSSVTHELRTPLNSIVSLSRLLLQHADGDLSAEQEKQVGFILRSAQNLTELVNDLLDLAKVEAGKVSVRPSRVAITDVFSALRGMFRPLVQSEHVELRIEMPSDKLELITDEGKLAQILRNLISNALKFTDRGEVVVAAKRFDASVLFSVSDTGVGIAPENRELVLQEWAQVEGAGPAKHRGSGLGLPLSKKFAELLGGEMWFESELGCGSRFFVRLPIGYAAEPSVVPDAAQPEASVAIIDDDEVARYLLRRQLATLTSAPILEAVNGKAGLDLLRDRRPALAVMDFVMPGLNGMELASAVRSDPQLRDLRLLLITSKTLTQDERSGLDALHTDVLERKDTSSDEQRVVLERALLEVGLSNMHQGDDASWSR